MPALRRLAALHRNLSPTTPHPTLATQLAPAAAADGADQPLAGVTVVEMAMVIAAPQACALMADMGARVIKVEPPGGEMWRKQGIGPSGVDSRGEPFTTGFEQINRGKESVQVRPAPTPPTATHHAPPDC